jgi:hypothetical protein
MSSFTDLNPFAGMFKRKPSPTVLDNEIREVEILMAEEAFNHNDCSFEDEDYENIVDCLTEEEEIYVHTA